MSPVAGLEGLRDTALTEGAVLETVRVSLRVVPVFVPSEGVTEQVITSSRPKPVDRVLAVPTVVPPTVQAIVEASGSPSGSLNPV